MNHETKAIFIGFKSAFSRLCESHNGVYSADDSIGEGACFNIPTSWGQLRVSIYEDHWGNRRGDNFIECVFMRFRDYTGPAIFPLHGNFNRFSHKWNITISSPGGTLADVRKHALSELRVRLELLAELYPIKA